MTRARHDHDPAEAAPSRRFLDIGHMRGRDLEKLFLQGERPDLDALVGWEHRGMNTPAFARILGIKKFVKGFYRPFGNAREVYGYNCPVVQNRLDEPWHTKPDDHHPRRFGFYRVSEVDPTARDNAYLHALLLDYSRGHNPGMDPSRGLRDYLVRVEGERDTYLGKAFYALGNARLPLSFFVLERLRRAPEDPFF